MNSVLFDVFLSYSRADQAIVERVAQALHTAGLKVFLDRWYLAAGRSWPEALEDALAGCRAVAILLGPDGLGRWQQREQYKALDRQTQRVCEQTGFVNKHFLQPFQAIASCFAPVQAGERLGDRSNAIMRLLNRP